MKVTIFGAIGRTGQEMLLQCLARGHDVIAIVRDPDRFAIRYDRLKVVRGDALKPESFDAALAGQDAVLSALGVTGFRNSLRPMTFYRDSTRAIVDRMNANGVRRLALVSTVGVVRKLSAPLWYRAIVKPLLRHKYADMRNMEDVVLASGLDWTIVRAAQLVEGPLTRRYRIGRNGTLPNIGKISRSDLADFVAAQADDCALTERAVAISY